MIKYCFDFLYKNAEIRQGKSEFVTLPGSYDENNGVEQLCVILWDKYYPSVNEAAAWGLYADPEGDFTDEYFKSVAFAEEKLTKYYSYDYWRIIAEE